MGHQHVSQTSMAAFKSHYNLCPLLGGNHKLVGISADKDEDTVLVTLGPNIVAKQKLSDQKPLKSWSTRQSNHLTCQTVYDNLKEKYVGVINKKHICIWDEEESNLEDVKKQTFSTNIKSVHTLNDKSSVIVFENGYTENLDVSLLKRKQEKPRLIKPDDSIAQSHLECIKDQPIVILFTSNNMVYFVRLGSDGTPEGHLSFTLAKDGSKTLGKAIITNEQFITVLVLWSDGELIQYSEQGKVMATHNLTGISLSSPIAMVMLDATHIAVYGADESDEGAILLLCDLKFRMNVATRRLKFFCDPPLLYCTNNVLLLCIVQNLVVVPYILQPSVLWNLIDSRHKPEFKAKPEISLVSTSMDATSSSQNPLKFRKAEITDLAQTIWEAYASHSRLFDELVPPLKEDQDLDGIRLLLTCIKDLPEKWQADLLNFCLEQSTEEMESQQSNLLKILLSTPYSDVVLLNHLRRKLTTKSTIKLLEHLANLLEVEIRDDSDLPTVSQIVDWISLVLDAHHHELLIAGNDVQVKQLVKRLHQLVSENYQFLDCLQQSEPLLDLLKQNKKQPENRRKDWYAIEVVRLL